MPELRNFLIWSNEHVAWWGPAHCGYVLRVKDAGRYSHAEAIEVCRKALPTGRHIGVISELPIRVEDLQAFMPPEE